LTVYCSCRYILQIYDCRFEEIAEKAILQPRYEEYLGYSSLKFTRRSQGDLAAMLTQAFEEQKSWNSIRQTMTNPYATRFGCATITGLMQIVHVACVYNHVVVEQTAAPTTMAPVTTQGYHHFETTEEYRPWQETTPDHFWDWMTTHYPYWQEETTPYHFWDWYTTQYPHWQETTPDHFWDWMTTHYPHWEEETTPYYFWDWMTTHYPHWQEDTTPDHFWDWMTTHYPHWQDFETTVAPHEPTVDHFFNGITTDSYNYGGEETAKHEAAYETTPGYFWEWFTTDYYKKK
ncbi:hypothetical protein OESDEN_24440, partial [Oesophagostomum dentatum]